MAIYQDRRALRGLDGVGLDVVHAPGEVIPGIVSIELDVYQNAGGLAHVNCVFCAVRRTRGALRKLIMNKGAGEQPYAVVSQHKLRRE